MISTKSESENLYTLFRPFFILLKVFGLIPLSFNGRDDVILKPFDCFYITLCFVSHSVLLAINLAREAKKFTNYSILNKGWQYTVDGYLITLLICSGYQIMKRKNFKKFLDLLGEFDAKSNIFIKSMDLNRHRFYSTFSLYTSVAMISSTTILTDLVFTLLSNVDGDHLICWSWGYSDLYFMMMCYQLIFAALALKSRFENLNENLK
jgi:hypothetical protein